MIQRVSATKLRCWNWCRKKYFFRYVEGLEPRHIGAALRFGRAIHAGFDYLLTEKPLGFLWEEELKATMLQAYTEQLDSFSPEDEIELQKAMQALRAWVKEDPLNVYQASPRSAVVASESGFCISVGYARRIVGYFDAILGVQGESWVLEHKTTSRVDGKYFNNLLRDEQASMYILAARELGYDVKGVLYNIVLKPSIRLSKRETQEEYIKRVGKWYKEPGRFIVHRVTRTENQLTEFRRDLTQAMADMRKAEREESFYRAPQNCSASYYTCEYDSICLEDTPEAREGLFTERAERRRS